MIEHKCFVTYIVSFYHFLLLYISITNIVIPHKNRKCELIQNTILKY